MDLGSQLDTAIAHFRAGRFAEAEKFAREVLAHDPQQVDALHLLGVIAHQFRHYQVAVDLFSQAARLYPGAHELQTNLGAALRSVGRIGDSIPVLTRAVSLDPNNVQAWQMLALSTGDIGDYEQAAQAWQRVCQLRPDDPQARSNFGTSLDRLGRFAQAVEVQKQAIQLDPNYAPAHSNLAAVLAQLGHYHEAIAEDLQAIKLAPNYGRAYVSLACTYQLVGMLAESLAAGRKAIELVPEEPNAHRNLATVLQEIGKIDDARDEYKRAIELFKKSSSPAERDIADRLRLAAMVMMPQVYESAEHVTRSRERFLDELAQLEKQGFKLALKNEAAPTLFDLAYQGYNDRDIAERYARLIQVADDRTPRAQATANSSTGEIRIGFISRFLRSHTIGQLNVGLIENLSREKFEVIVMPIGDYRDEISARLQKCADKFLILPTMLNEARRLIAAQHLDILFYTDIGMDPVSYSLAFSRLAPIQMTTWGHPVTTGIPSIDYFLSSDLLESPGSESQYTEKLVKLKNLSVHYDRPIPSASTKSRADFALPADATLYGCLQMIWKFHPEFDPLLAEILRRDPRGRLVLVHSLNEHLDDMLLSRFKRVMPGVVDRVVFVPRQKREDFFALTAACDVMLDPIHFCGGNTSYEAFAFGIPIVTLPSQMLRGRLTAAMYQMMGLDEMIARSEQDYIERAIRLGTDASHRNQARATILQRNQVLFSNATAVRELEEFLLKIAKAK